MVFARGQDDGRTRPRGSRAGRTSCGEGGEGGLPPPAVSAGNRLNLLLTAPAWRAESWADRLPPLLDPLGVRSMRAQTARQAEQVILQATIHIAVVDLTLPLDEGTGPAEEGGTRILDLLARMSAPPPTVVVQAPRGHRDSARCMSAALRCGAFAVIDRSAADIERMLDVMRRMLERFYSSRWPDASAPAPPARLYEDPRHRGPV